MTWTASRSSSTATTSTTSDGTARSAIVGTSDKVAPIIRWAEVRIERTPRLHDGDYWTRRHHFAGLLGDTVMGRHALQHLDHLFGEENPWAYWGYPGRPTWEEGSVLAASRSARSTGAAGVCCSRCSPGPILTA